MAVTILSSDIVKKEYIKSVGEYCYGSKNRWVEQFISAVFDKKEELTFQQFIAHFFQHINIGLSKCDQEILLKILEDDSPPNEVLKLSAKKYKEKYSD